MAMCDICANPNALETVDGADFRKAVEQGYDPFAMGLSGPTLRQIASMGKISGEDPYEAWRTRVESSDLSVWQVCDACIPALRPFLDRKAAPPITARDVMSPTKCTKCGEQNPASQWHCSHCGHVQWGLIVFSILTGLGLGLWGVVMSGWFWRWVVLAFALLFLWIGISSIKEARRDRRY